MSPLANIFRTQKLALPQATYQNGATVTVDVPRGLLLKALHCRLSGTVTVAAVNGTAILSEAPLGCITRVELVADGRKPFVSDHARALFRLNHIISGKRPEILPPTSPNIGTYPISGKFRIDLEAKRFAVPLDSYLDTRLYDGLQLRFTFGPGSTIITPGGGGTVTVDAGTVVDVIGEYTAVGFEFPKFARIIIAEDIPVVAVSNNLRQAIPRNGILAHTLVRTEIDGGLVDTLINNVTTRSDNTVYHRDHCRWATTQAANVEDYQLDLGGTGGLINGYNFLDFSEDGMLSSCIDTTNVNSMDNLFDVNLPAGVNRNIHLTHVFYEPLIR